MYLVTMVIEGRRPLFGEVVGRSDAEAGMRNEGAVVGRSDAAAICRKEGAVVENPDEPRIVLSELGKRVEDCWYEIAERYPEITIVALQMMPDHFHGILFVKKKMEKPLGKVLLGFKQGCNKAYRELFPQVPSVQSVPSVPSVPSVAVLQQQTKQQQTQQQLTQPLPPRPKQDRSHGLLFAPGYNDKLLLRQGQLQRWLDYLRDNPRRLLMKRERPDLFRVQRGLTVGTQQFSAIGNRFLLSRPVRLQVQCSRSLTDEQIAAKVQSFLQQARQGAVLVSPSISKGEKAIMRAAFDEGLPLIILQENGFTDLAKPGGRRMEACMRGQLLLLAPWEHHNERLTIRRSQCLSLNEMARLICETNF